MEFQQNPRAEPAEASNPRVHTKQYVVLWPDPVSTRHEPQPIIGTIDEVDEEIGRIVVQVPAIRRKALSELGARVVLIAAATGDGIYYRQCDVDLKRSDAEQVSLTVTIPLSATDDWRRLQRRQAERTSVSIVLGEISCYPTSGGFRRLAATIRNISTSGLLLETGDPLQVDDELQLHIPLSDGKPPLRVRARVIRTLAAPPRPGVWFAGCRFEGLHANEQARIGKAMPGLPGGSPSIT